MRPYERGLYVRRASVPRPVTLSAGSQVFVPLEHGETPLVSEGDPVRLGQRIAAGDGQSVPLHAGVSGLVSAIVPRTCADGQQYSTLVLENDGRNRPDPSIRPRAVLDGLSDEALLGSLADAGIRLPDGVPLAAAVTQGRGKPLAVSLMDPEPGLCAGEAALLFDREATLSGIWLLAGLLGTDRATLVVGSGQREAVRAAKRWSGDRLGLCVAGGPCPAGHPARLSDVLDGAVVVPAHVAAAAAHACYEGIPVMRGVVCVWREGGQALFDVPLGIPVRTVLEAAGVQDGVVILGGPLTGRPLACLDGPVVKGLEALTVFNSDGRSDGGRTACVRCGRCERVCPVGLRPWVRFFGGARRERSDCLHCGACQFVCPAGLPLATLTRNVRTRSAERK